MVRLHPIGTAQGLGGKYDLSAHRLGGLFYRGFDLRQSCPGTPIVKAPHLTGDAAPLRHHVVCAAAGDGAHVHGGVPHPSAGDGHDRLGCRLDGVDAQLRREGSVSGSTGELGTKSQDGGRLIGGAAYGAGQV